MKLCESVLPLLLLLSPLRLALAQNVWELSEPDFQHDRLVVTLDYGFNSKISTNQVKYTLFDGEGCQEGSRQISIQNSYLTSQMTFKHSDTRTAKINAEISLSVVADNIGSSPIYERVDDDHVMITFCVRFSLYTGDASDSNSFEVNFLETPVNLRYKIKDEFNIDLTNVLPASDDEKFTAFA